MFLNYFPEKKVLSDLCYLDSKETSYVNPTYITKYPNVLTRNYKYLIRMEIFIQRKYVTESITEIINILYPNLLTLTKNTPLEISYENTREKLDLINDVLGMKGYLRKFGTADKSKVLDAFRLEVISRLSVSNEVGFRTVMFILVKLTAKYFNLIYIPVNDFPTIKINHELAGFGAFLDDETMISYNDKESFLNEIRELSLLIPNSAEDRVLVLEQINEFINSILNDGNLSAHRRYNGETENF